MTVRHAPALLLGLLSLGLLSMAAAPPARAQPAPPYGANAPDTGPPTVGPHQMPLFAVSGVEVAQVGPLTAVKVRGVTSTMGWQEPTLVPLVRRIPSDGVLDLVLVAEPPTEAMAASGFVTVEAVLMVEANHPFRGVRVRSASNVLALAGLPGKAEAPGGVEDCHACVGRTLGGAGAIARDTLPKNTRILGPADPFTDISPDPNRLTLLVGDDGKVIEAFWQ